VFYINYFFIAVEKMLFLQKTVNEMWVPVCLAMSFFTYAHRCDTAGAKL
jgi:hypothetical protein